MKVLLVGAKGMLGTCFLVYFTRMNDTVVCFDIHNIDIGELDSVKKAFSNHKDADVIINCAAYTKVDDCESNQQLANRVNGYGPANLAVIADDFGIPLVHFSTDYVFDGQKKDPYTETDPVAPINAYGQSKLLGEQRIIQNAEQHYIFRIQWMYGQHGPNFVNTILKAADSRSEIDVVNDQFGSPSWTGTVVEGVVDVLKKRPEWGIYNLANSGTASWYEFAAFFLEKAGKTVQVNPVSAAQFSRPAPRPANSRLDLEKIHRLGIVTPTWQDAVAAYLKEIQRL